LSKLNKFVIITLGVLEASLLGALVALIILSIYRGVPVSLDIFIAGVLSALYCRVQKRDWEEEQ